MRYFTPIILVKVKTVGNIQLWGRGGHSKSSYHDANHVHRFKFLKKITSVSALSFKFLNVHTHKGTPPGKATLNDTKHTCLCLLFSSCNRGSRLNADEENDKVNPGTLIF